LRTRFRNGALGAVVLAIAALGSGPINAEPAIIKMGSTAPAASGQVKDIYDPWIAEMEKDSEGTLKIQAFHGGSLVRSYPKQYEALINGLQDAATIVTSYTEKLFPDFGLFSLPFMFRGPGSDEAAYVAWKLYERGMIGNLEKVHVVAVYTNDNSGLHFNVPIKSVDDIKGLKIRTAGPGEADVIKLVGGVPVAIAITQVAESLHRGLIHGTLNGWSALNSFRITPLIKGDVDLPFGVRSFFNAFNAKVYAALPEKAKSAIAKNGGMKLSMRFGKYWANEGAQLRAQLAKDHPVLRPSEEEIEKVWEPKFKHIQQGWIDEDKAHRQKLYDEAKKLSAEYRAKGS
jgi:TRAP-type transport system periplasmic protein